MMLVGGFVLDRGELLIMVPQSHVALSLTEGMNSCLNTQKGMRKILQIKLV